MDLFLALSQGVGISLASGFRPPLAGFVVGVLARLNAGVDFGGTGYSFLESIPWLVALLIVVVVQEYLERFSLRLLIWPLGALALLVGALEFGGSLSDQGYAPVPGLAAGALCALVGLLAVRAFIGAAANRLAARGQSASASLLSAYVSAATVAVAALACLVPPISYLPLAFCVWVLIDHRRRAGRKYEGLRVLR